MNFGGMGFIVGIVFLSTMGWVLTTWIRARHGYPVEGEYGGQALANQDGLLRDNAELREQVGRLEKRVAVLERIATEQPDALTREIEELRTIAPSPDRSREELR